MGRYKYFAGVKGRKQRQRLRKGICLQDAGITANTQARYYTSVSKLMPHVLECKTMEQMDDSIAQWIETEFHKGKPPVLCRWCPQRPPLLSPKYTPAFAVLVAPVWCVEETRGSCKGASNNSWPCFSFLCKSYPVGWNWFWSFGAGGLPRLS